MSEGSGTISGGGQELAREGLGTMSEGVEVAREGSRTMSRGSEWRTRVANDEGLGNGMRGVGNDEQRGQAMARD